MFNWLYSFFSAEAHIKYMMLQLSQAAHSVKIVKDRLTVESAELEFDYQTRRKGIDHRFAVAEHVGKTVAAFAPFPDADQDR